MRIALFGGNGYLGQHLQYELRKAAEVPAIIGRDTLCTEQFDVLVHMACPRNKPATWDWGRAEAALDQGLQLARNRHARVVFISSMSVYDVPDNGYSQFKRMAERVVLAQGGVCLRLPTLLGTAPGVGVYRKDLGLHRIAEALAQGRSSFVNAKAIRHVRPVWAVARDIVDCVRYGIVGVHELTAGTVWFSDIVPTSVPLQYQDAGRVEEYTPVGARASQTLVADLQMAFNSLVEWIANGTARAV